MSRPPQPAAMERQKWVGQDSGLADLQEKIDTASCGEEYTGDCPGSPKKTTDGLHVTQGVASPFPHFFQAEYYENRMNSEGLRACGDLRYRVHQILTSLGECQLFVQGLTLTGLSCKHDTLDLCLVPGYTGYAEWWASQGIKHSEYQTQFVTRMAAALAEQMDAGFEVQAGGSCPRVKAKTTTEAVPVVFTVCLDYSAVRISLLQQRYLTGWVQVRCGAPWGTLPPAASDPLSTPERHPILGTAPARRGAGIPLPTQGCL